MTRIPIFKSSSTLSFLAASCGVETTEGVHAPPSPEPGILACYVRSATGDAASLARQEKAALAFFRHARFGGDALRVHRFADPCASGLNTNRSAFRRLKDAVKAGGIAAVYVERTERISRNLADTIRFVLLLKAHQVDLIVGRRPSLHRIGARAARSP